MRMRRTVVVMVAAVATLLAAAWPAAAQPQRAPADQEAQVDFNGDAFADLAVGAPGEGVGGATGAGALNVLYGSATGLEPSAAIFIQGSGGVQGTAETDDSFGAAVTKGDFNGDDFFDVAVGAPGEGVGSVGGAGAVNVLYGSAAGLGGGPLFVQSNPEVGDGFGAAVAPTDANAIGQWDLAVGAPGEDIGPDVDAGVVNLLAGSVSGPSGGSLVQQSNPEDFDSFGQAIAGGFFLHDFDGNGFFDLAVGAPLERVGADQSAGLVSVFYASGGGGLGASESFTQDSPGLGGSAEAFDFFGAALE
jgi:hypothetical protein